MMGFGGDLNQPLLWASGLSIVTVIVTLITVPWVVIRLPQDYFCGPERTVWRPPSEQPVFALLLGLLKNLLGLLLLILGLVMLVTPGQGLLTLLAGLLIMNFPGKYQLERWLVMRPGVLRGLNWLRRRQKQIPFDAPS
ncbi:MAG: hypothetical protein ACJAZE_001788 [Halioglobus sp.]|jgi:hypothetical protein